MADQGAPARGVRAAKLIAAAAGAAFAAVLAATCPIEGLSFQATAVLGILVMAIVWWVTGVLPELVTAIVMAVLFVVVGGVSVGAAFSTFSTDTWWLLLAAFALGVGMKESGLMRRIALGIVHAFPRTFGSQVAAQLVAGTVLGPLIPSLAVKGAMLAPLAMGIGDAMGYERQGKQACGLFAAMLVGIRTVAPTIVSASVTGYALLATLPADVQAHFNMAIWFVAALPWLVVVLALNFGALMLLYRPRKGSARGPAAADGPSRGPAAADGPAVPEKGSLGPLSPVERRMLGIILTTVVLWATQPFHGVPAFAVGLAAVVAMFALKVIDSKSFKAGINWESLLFIGIALGLGSVFSEVGLNDWVMATCGPYFELLAGNPYALVVGVGLITVALRFLIVSEIAYLNLLMAFLVPLAVAHGIDPWVLGFSAYALVIAWFAKYQSPIYLAAFYAVDGKMARHADMAKYCGVYLAICLVGLVVSVPYWQLLGLL